MDKNDKLDNSSENSTENSKENTNNNEQKYSSIPNQENYQENYQRNNQFDYQFDYKSQNNNIKPKSVFWGSLLIMTGIVILLNKFNLDLNIYNESILNFWSLLLVLYGISFFKLPLLVRQINALLGAVLVVVFFLNATSSSDKWLNIVKKSSIIKVNTNTKGSGIDSNLDYDNLSDHTESQKIILDTNINRSQLILNLAAGEFQLYSNNSDNLFEVMPSIKGMGELLSSIDTIKNIKSIVFNSNENRNFDEENNGNRGEFLLNTKSNWEIQSNVGVGQFDFDLTGLKFKTFLLNAGAAEVNLKVGDLFENSDIEINSGATEINIKIPKKIGCQIISKTALSENDFIGFTKIGKNKYQTPNFNNTNPKLFIKIDGGMSSYKVETY